MRVLSQVPSAEPAPLIGKVPEVRAVENRAALYPPEQESETSLCMQISRRFRCVRWGLRACVSSTLQYAPRALWVTSVEPQTGGRR